MMMEMLMNRMSLMLEVVEILCVVGGELNQGYRFKGDNQNVKKIIIRLKPT